MCTLIHVNLWYVATGAPLASEFLKKEGESAWEYAQRVFDLVYVRDVERVAGIDVLWEKRSPPKPLQPSATLFANFSEPTECSGRDVVKFLGLNPREVCTFPSLTPTNSKSLNLRAAPTGACMCTEQVVGRIRSNERRQEVLLW